jgi:hypothetical protein
MTLGELIKLALAEGADFDTKVTFDYAPEGDSTPTDVNYYKGTRELVVYNCY